MKGPVFNTPLVKYDTRDPKDICSKDFGALYYAQSEIVADDTETDEVADEKLELITSGIHQAAWRAAFRRCEKIAQIEKDAQEAPFTLETNPKFLN